MLQGVTHSHEGEIDGSGFRFGATRRGHVAVFPVATTMDFVVASTRVSDCEPYFPPSFANDQLGFRDDRQLAFKLGKLDPFLFHAVERFAALQHSHDDISELQKESLFHTMAMHLFANHCHERAAPLSPPSGRLPLARAMQLHSYIEDNLSRRLNRDEMAPVAGCDSREFLALFRNTFGATPAQYVIDGRLDRATQLIRDTTRDFTQVALDVGFSSQSHLTTALRKRRGITPNQIRRRSIRVFGF